MTGMVDFEFEFQYAEAKQTALRDIRLPERLIMIVAVIFLFFPVLSGDMKLLRQSVATRGLFAALWEKLRASGLSGDFDRSHGAARHPHRRNAFRLRRDARHRPQAPQEQFSVAPLLRA